jgi:RNA polymerase sigma-70 factor (ECF subfamily)
MQASSPIPILHCSAQSNVANSASHFVLPELVSAPITDEALLTLEPNLLIQLEQLRPKVFNYCLAYLHHNDDAEEACQETMYNALKAIHNFAQRASLQTWVLKIAQNACTAYYRKNKRQQAQFEDFDESVYFIEETLRDEENPELAASLMLLSQVQRDVLRMRFVDELPLNDIALGLGLSLSAVKMNYYRALSKLQQVYKQV